MPRKKTTTDTVEIEFVNHHRDADGDILPGEKRTVSADEAHRLVKAHVAKVVGEAADVEDASTS